MGVPNNIYVDGVFAVVRPKPGSTLSAEEVFDYCKGIASYKRPVHIEFWPSDQHVPMNKTGKADAMALIEEVKAITEKLRQQGGWDAL